MVYGTVTSSPLLGRPFGIKKDTRRGNRLFIFLPCRYRVYQRPTTASQSSLLSLPPSGVTVATAISEPNGDSTTKTSGSEGMRSALLAVIRLSWTRLHFRCWPKPCQRKAQVIFEIARKRNQIEWEEGLDFLTSPSCLVLQYASQLYTTSRARCALFRQVSRSLTRYVYEALLLGLFAFFDCQDPWKIRRTYVLW